MSDEQKKYSGGQREDESETGMLPNASSNVNERQDSATSAKEPRKSPRTEVYVLLLGSDSKDFTKYVGKVMSAEKCLSKMGHNVVGAFI